MIAQVKSILQTMGNGLANQDLGDTCPTAHKVAQIEKKGQNYRSSGG
jgi:hypothetical protein